jgi:hypothetical protein
MPVVRTSWNTKDIWVRREFNMVRSWVNSPIANKVVAVSFFIVFTYFGIKLINVLVSKKTTD